MRSVFENSLKLWAVFESFLFVILLFLNHHKSIKSIKSLCCDFLFFSFRKRNGIEEKKKKNPR